MATSKEIRARIQSVKNTGKITRAMELISTVKMKKAQESVFASRPFALAALRVLSHTEGVLGRLLAPDASATQELVVLIASNKGLCGGYNVGVLRTLAKFIKTRPDTQFQFVSVGKKSREYLLRTGCELMGDFPTLAADKIDLHSVKELSRFLLGAYQSGQYRAIHLVETRYRSAISQDPMVRQFLPLASQDILSYLATSAGVSSEITPDTTEYRIEPDAATIAQEALPLVLDAMLYETLLECKASEHASRMVAMKNAKDSASKKTKSLTLAYNKARQFAITKEVSEIVSGVESMKDVTTS